MKTRYAIVLFVLLGVLLAACTPPEEKPVAEAKPRAVQVETVLSRDLPIVVKAVGRLAPDREVVRSAQVSGIVERYTADVGDRVAAGATLVQLDDADHVLALQEAEANLETARIRLPVQKTLSGAPSACCRKMRSPRSSSTRPKQATRLPKPPLRGWKPWWPWPGGRWKKPPLRHPLAAM